MTLEVVEIIMRDLFRVLCIALTSFTLSTFLLVYLGNRKGIRMRTHLHKRIEDLYVRLGIIIFKQ